MKYQLLLETDSREERYKIYDKLMYKVTIGKITMGDLLSGLYALRGRYLIEFYDYITR